MFDEATGALFLEARRGIDDANLRRTRMPINEDTPAGRVIKTGKAIRISSQPGQAAQQVMTGYLVQALAYVSISLGGVTFGVLASAHREPGKSFDDHDERLLGAIADYAAIAIQNARLYRDTDQALNLRVREHDYPLRSTIAGIESKLDPRRFARIHRSYIVNMDLIASIEPLDTGEARLHLKDRTTLPCSCRAS